MNVHADSSPLTADHAAQLLDELLFERVANLLDVAALYDLEATLTHQIEQLGVPCDHARTRARTMIDRALLRIAQKPRRWLPTTGPAPGIECCALCGEPLCGDSA